MQKKENKTVSNSKVATFFKRNVYYVLMVVCVLAIGTMITLAAVYSNKDNQDVVAPPIDGGGTDTEVPPIDNPKEEFIIISPVSGAETKMVFNDKQLVLDQTENKYYTHLGVDFMGDAGKDVVAVFGGTIESVSSDGYKGTVVVIDHGNGYKSTYALLDGVELKKGANVNKGDKIGVIGSGYSFENKEGTHVHLTISHDGKEVDPMQFIAGTDK